MPPRDRNRGRLSVVDQVERGSRVDGEIATRRATGAG